jgi:predicted AAA+ superfamily ATPase
LTFLKRQIVSEIEKYLATDDVIVIHGARQVGKTSVMYYIRDGLTKQGETTHYMDLEDSRLVNLLDRGPDEFIKHLKEEGLLPEEGGRKAFVFIDEIQYLSNPSSFIKLVADHHKNIKLIISGSSSFGIKNKFKDSLAGRLNLNYTFFRSGSSCFSKAASSRRAQVNLQASRSRSLKTRSRNTPCTEATRK